jgi:hypothetical protein
MHIVWTSEPIPSGLIIHLAGDANNMGASSKASYIIRPQRVRSKVCTLKSPYLVALTVGLIRCADAQALHARRPFANQFNVLAGGLGMALGRLDSLFN